MPKQLTYALIDSNAAADCARHIERGIKNNWFEDADKAQAIADALWALTNGSAMAREAGYASGDKANFARPVARGSVAMITGK